jgi:hypothetical protein
MKSKTLMAMAVAGSFMTTGALANGMHENTEIQTPSSVSESAPWLTGQPHLSSWGSHGKMSSTEGYSAVGASSDTRGFGSGGYDSSMSSMTGGNHVANKESVDYWLLGESSTDMSESSIVSDAGTVGYDGAMGVGSMSYSLSSGESLAAGATSSEGGSGSVAFDSSMSVPADAYAMTSDQHYLVLGALDSFDPRYALILETGHSSEDIALLEHLSGDFYVLTPIYPRSDV